jgi:hypothetical protein
MRPSQTFQKRQREMARQEKQREKAQRKQQRKLEKQSGAAVEPTSSEKAGAESGETASPEGELN